MLLKAKTTVSPNVEACLKYPPALIWVNITHAIHIYSCHFDWTFVYTEKNVHACDREKLAVTRAEW